MIPILLFIVIMSCSVSACAPVRPIRELRIVETLGCDWSDDGVTLSIAAAKPQLRLTQAAPSLRLAMDRLRDQSASEALFFAHTRFLMIGQTMAENDLAPALDLMARSADMRLRTPVFLLKNADAAEAVQTGDEEQDVTKMLAALQADYAEQGTGAVFSCAETLAALAERGAALAAACTLESGTLRPAGYGILKDGRCVGWIAPPVAQGVNLLCALGGHGDVRLDDATVTLSACEAAFHPRWDGETLAGLDISLKLRAALTETDGRRDDTTDAARAALEQALSETVRGWCETILRQSQTFNADFLDLAGHIRHDNPAKWHKIAPEWSAIWPTLAWTVTAEATLDRTLDLEAPVPLGGTK
ncbi:MAG: hypothetical protein IJI27_06360 [Oscillospiraceae bacterium]|nr:hypothetical protein [Oscillospiraceae bacterium]